MHHDIGNFNILAVNWDDRLPHGPLDGSLGFGPNPIITGSDFLNIYDECKESANNGIDAAKPLAYELLEAGMQPAEGMLIGHSNGAGFMASLAEESYNESSKQTACCSKIQELAALDAPLETPPIEQCLPPPYSIDRIDNYYTPTVQSTVDNLWPDRPTSDVRVRRPHVNRQQYHKL